MNDDLDTVLLILQGLTKHRPRIEARDHGLAIVILITGEDGFSSREITFALTTDALKDPAQTIRIIERSLNPTGT